MPETASHLMLIRKRMALLTIALSFCFILSFLVVGWSLKESHDSAVRDRHFLCLATNRANDGLKKILLLVQESNAKRKLSPVERRRAIQFYKQAFALLVDVNCP